MYEFSYGNGLLTTYTLKKLFYILQEVMVTIIHDIVAIS